MTLRSESPVDRVDLLRYLDQNKMGTRLLFAGNLAARLLRYHLARAHQLELADMAYTLDDFKHDTWRLLLDEVPRLSAEERAALLERIDAEERLRGLGPEERLRGLGPEELRQLLDYLKTLH